MENRFEIIRSRRKTLSIEIKRDLRIIVRAPLRTSEAVINRFLSEKSDWIQNKLDAAKKLLAEQTNIPKLTADELTRLKAEARARIPSRAEHLASIVGVSFRRITLRTQVTRWGSCSAGGTLSLNCLLMLCPTEVLDYVIIHELCHLRHPNHSRTFWDEVEKHMPSYREAKTWLKENGAALIHRLPNLDT